jgi:hypothetical protein
MKRILPLLVRAVLPPFAMVLLAAALMLPARASAAPQSKAVTVDYVIGLLDAGIGQQEILDRIKEKDLTFHLEPGDTDRLREAGAGEDLIAAVTGEAVDRWGRPSRLGRQAYYGYGYSDFLFYYPYPYYSFPHYYLPYGPSIYYSPYYHYPRYGHHGVIRGGGGFRGAPRGGRIVMPRPGGSRSSPRGSHH